MFKNANPLSVANFIANVKNNLYEKKYFYKIINFPNTKIVHGGVFSDNKLEKNNRNFLFQKTIPLEIKLKNKETIYGIQIFDPLKIKNVENKFKKGTLAMVKADSQSSSSTEFFFSLNETPEFDGRYSVIGRVINGLNVLKSIEKDDFIKFIEFSY